MNSYNGQNHLQKLGAVQYEISSTVIARFSDGPLGSYDSLCDLSKLILSANMYIGRLELASPYLTIFFIDIEISFLN